MADAELHRFTPEFDVQLDDISHQSDEELRARAMGPEATLGFLFLRDGRRDRLILEELANWADLFRAVVVTPNGQRAILQLFSYLSRVAPNLGLKELAERVQQTIPDTENVVMTLAEQLIEQGEKSGIEKGRKEGQKEGYKMLVRRQIALRFGALDSTATARLEAADELALERYSDRLLTATTVDEVLAD